MKILLEESDLLEIVTNHVKSTNLLNLANKEFHVELEIDGTEVTASIQTSAASLTPSDKPKKKTTRRKTNRAQEKTTESVEAANEEEKPAETKEETETSNDEEAQATSTEEVEETPEEDEVVEDKPPFFKNVKPSEPVTETDDKPRKSLFK